jgi:Flp pilus assembly protein TadB
MAQTRRKRKRRHRGTQAGTIEARGRTSRPSGERKSSGPAKKPANRAEARAVAQQKRQARYDTPPSWRSALNRSAFAAALFGVVMIAAFRRPVVQGLALAAVMVFMYLPMSYYTDKFVYNRRQKQKARQTGKGR